MEIEEIEKQIRKDFKMKGLILADVKVIKMQDNTLESGTSNIIPAGITKDEEINNFKNGTYFNKHDSAAATKTTTRHGRLFPHWGITIATNIPYIAMPRALQPVWQYVARRGSQKSSQRPAQIRQRYESRHIRRVGSLFPLVGHGKDLVRYAIGHQQPFRRGHFGIDPLGQRQAHKHIAEIYDKSCDGYLQICRSVNYELRSRQLTGAGKISH